MCSDSSLERDTGNAGKLVVWKNLRETPVRGFNAGKSFTLLPRSIAMRLLLPSAILFAALSSSHAVVTVIDNNTAGYSTTGSWSSQNIAGRYAGTWQYQNAPGAADTATWDFTGLASGKYILAASTFTQGNISTSATYTTTDGGGTHTRNQQAATNHFDIDTGTNSGVTFARISSFNGYTPITVIDGNLSTTLSDNVPSLFLVADAVRLESVRADVEKIFVIGNGDAGYSETNGGWNTWAGDVGDHGADFRFSNGGIGDLITVNFTGIDPGAYRISTAWTAGGNRTQSATLAYSTPGSSGSVTFDQRPGAAADDSFEEVNWEDMFSTVNVTGNSLTLTLRNNNAGPAELLIADAFRLEKITAVPEPSSAILGGIAALGLLRRRRAR